MGERQTAERMLLVDELILSGDDGAGYLELARPVLIPAGHCYWVDGAELVVEDGAGGMKRYPGDRPGYPRREMTEPRTFRAIITSGTGTSSRRASVLALDRREAQVKLEAEFGIGTVFDLTDEDAANRRR